MREIFGFHVIVDEGAPPDEIRFVDPVTEKCVAKIVNIKPPPPPSSDGE